MDSKMMSSRIGNVPFIPSSSPPPIDSVPSEKDFFEDDYGVTDNVDETYDITGLSQKLDSCKVNSSSPIYDSNSSSNRNYCNAQKAINTNLSVDKQCDYDSKLHYLPDSNIEQKNDNDSVHFPTMSPPPLNCISQINESFSGPIEVDDNKSITERVCASENNLSETYNLKSKEKTDRPNENYLIDSEEVKYNESEISDREIIRDHLDIKPVLVLNENISDDEFGDFMSNENDFPESKSAPSNYTKVIPEESYVSPEDAAYADIRLASIPHVDDDGTSVDDNFGVFASVNKANSSEDALGDFSSVHKTNDSLIEPISSAITYNGSDAVRLVAAEEEDENPGIVSHHSEVENDANCGLSKEVIKMECSLDENILKEESDDEFGEFSSNNEVHNSSKLSSCEELNQFIDDNDDFGDFNSVSNTKDFQLEFSDDDEVEETNAEFPDEKHTNSGLKMREANFSDRTTIADKFRCLVLRWLGPLPTESPEEYEIGMSMAGLNNVVNGDTFIWRHLEDVESSSALKLSWSNTRTNKLFLSALNVDARNILYSHKWNSAIPLFAQTLSFSPLTPAKPASWNTEVKEPNRTCKKDEMNIEKGVAPPSRQSKKVTKSQNESSETEKVIPPAQFDWNSSGLKNPLDTPGLEDDILNKADSSNNTLKSTPSPILEKILKEKRSGPTMSTELSSLPPDVQEAVKRLPNLNFMRSKVLMFPILDDSLK